MCEEEEGNVDGVRRAMTVGVMKLNQLTVMKVYSKRGTGIHFASMNKS